MIRRTFGWTGVEVPVIGQGTWMIEGHRDAEARAIQTLRLGLDLGLTHIDTAEMYGSGRAEELTGEAIAGRRDEVFLVSKVLPANASYEGTLRACRRSLKRLGTDRLDLYLLHWAGSHPIGETMRAMEKLAADGFIRYFGVSNFDLEELQEAQQSVSAGRIACNQVLYHLGDRGIERRLLPYCEAQQIAVVGYSPFGHSGFPGPNSLGGKALAEVAARHGATPRQVALKFLTRHPGVFTIPKTTRPERVRENAGIDWELTPADLAAIDAAFPAPDHDTPLGMI
jgi:diketogulonate reductase-like aldo/keto reductase